MSIVQLPEELWLSVFEGNFYALTPADFNAIIRTCHWFRRLATPSLFRRIIWTNSSHFAESLKTWNDFPDLASLPRSLTVGLSISFSTSNEQLLLHGIITDDMVSASSSACNHLENELSQLLPSSILSHRATSCASLPVYSEMIAAARSFINLETLLFLHVVLPYDWQTIIHKFPRLRRLHLHSSVIPDSDEYVYVNHSELSIQEISVRNMAPTTICWLESLCSSHKINVLHIDPTATKFLPMSQTSNPKFLPTNLRNLYVHEVHSSTVEEIRVLMRQVAVILHTATWIESVCTFYPLVSLPLARFPVPSQHHCLISYRGPMTSMPVATFDAAGFQSRSVQELDLAGRHSNREWSDCLLGVMRRFQNLSVLVLRSVPGLTGVCFPGKMGSLRSLHIFPSGQGQIVRIFPSCFLMDALTFYDQGDYLAADLFISQLPALTTLQIQHPAEAEIGEGETQLVIRWGVYHSCLRSIQLFDGYFWRRSQNDVEWEVRVGNLLVNNINF